MTKDNIVVHSIGDDEQQLNSESISNVHLNEEDLVRSRARHYTFEEDDAPKWLADAERIIAEGGLPKKSLGYRFVKRTFDIAFSSCIIVVGFVPGLVLSVFVAADTKGTPIYASTRVGWSIIGQKSGSANANALRPALFALEARGMHHSRYGLGVAA